MTVRPLPAGHGSARRPGQQLVAAAAARVRRAPTPGGIARRRMVITLTKWLLPAFALMLLGSVALWPEIKRITDPTQVTFHLVAGDVAGARLTDTRYHGVDEHARPYTLTAAVAQQDGPDRINLTMPKGDMTLQNGSWLMVQAKQGVFIQRVNQLDLSHDVTLYRDDGTTITTESASIDMKAGAASSAEPTHAEGPFGMLDSQGFTLTDEGANIQFHGPAHVVLNGSSP